MFTIWPRVRRLVLPLSSLVAAWALALPAHAQTASAPVAPPITLREALTSTVQQNRTIRAGDADIEIALGNELGALGLQDFEIDAAGNWVRRRTSPVEGSPFQQTQFDSLHTEVSAVQPLFYGGRIGLKAANDYSRTTNLIDIGMGVAPFESTTDVWFPTLQLTYFQPILKGFGRDIYLAPQRRAAAATDVATLDLENTATNVVRDTILAYWELVYQVRDLEIRRSALNLAREQLRVTQARLDVGVGAPTDLAEVKQTIATREEDELLSDLTLTERSLDLRLLSGLPITATEMVLRPTDEPAPSAEAFAVETALAAAFEHNTQLAAIRGRGRQATIEIEVGENGLLPQLDLTANLGPSGTSNTLNDALDRLVHFKDYQVNVGLTFSFPVARHAAKGTVAAARGQLHKVQITEDDLKAQIAVAVARGVDLVRSTRKRLDVDAEAIQLAQVNLNAERARFDVGRSTNFDVLRRQDELAQAQLRRVRAGADYMKAVAVLQSVTGDLLPVYGIVVKPRR
jgi:outer membrane protein TolC